MLKYDLIIQKINLIKPSQKYRIKLTQRIFIKIQSLTKFLFFLCECEESCELEFQQLLNKGCFYPLRISFKFLIIFIEIIFSSYFVRLSSWVFHHDPPTQIYLNLNQSAYIHTQKSSIFLRVVFFERAAYCRDSKDKSKYAWTEPRLLWRISLKILDEARVIFYFVGQTIFHSPFNQLIFVI